MFRRIAAVVVAVALATFGFAAPAGATHSLNVHWARTANPFTLQVDDNLSTTAWHDMLATVASDWSTSTVLDLTVNQGSFGDRTVCDPAMGRIEVCNAKYGQSGWTGLAEVYFDVNAHIIRGSAKLNDTYLSRGSYPDAYDLLTICQEVGHNLGLAHQDENQANANLGTCMDYTSDADGPPSNEHPNAHDFAQLEADYAHTDSYSTNGFASMVGVGSGSWGRLVRSTSGGAVYLRQADSGVRVLTFVTWA